MIQHTCVSGVMFGGFVLCAEAYWCNIALAGSLHSVAGEEFVKGTGDEAPNTQLMYTRHGTMANTRLSEWAGDYVKTFLGRSSCMVKMCPKLPLYGSAKKKSFWGGRKTQEPKIP